MTISWRSAAGMLPILSVVSFACAPTSSVREPVAPPEPAGTPVVEPPRPEGSALETRVDTIPGTTVTMEFVRLPAGTVTLETEDGPTTVEVGPFWIRRTEVTWDEFDVYALGLDLETEEDRLADMVIRPSKPYGAPDRGFGHRGYAAISMSAGAANEYASWLSWRTGENYRLPTEAEWQYACMGGSDVDPGADKDALDHRAWYWDNAFDEAHAIASLEPNGFGLYDMLGNAMEWCVTGEGEAVGCGGSFNDKADAVSCHARAEQTPRWQETDPQIPKSLFWLTDAPFVGFRVVRDP